MRRVIAVDLGGTNIRAAVVDSTGRVSERLKTPNPRRGKKQILEAIAGLIRRVLDAARAKKIKIDGITLGCPGPVSAKTGVVFHAPNLPGWRNVPVKQFFQKRFKIPVVVENDANAYALGETWAGAGKGKRSSVCLTLGTGVGGGIILNGKVWHGADDIAGEIGHMVARENGQKCGCGNTGCLELYASATGVARRMREALSKPGNRKYWKTELPITSQNVFAAARNGNRLAREVATETSEILGAAITSLVHIINPEIVIVGGGVSENADLLFPPLRAEVKKRAFAQATQHLKIVPARLGDDAGLIGAARAFFLAHP